MKIAKAITYVEQAIKDYEFEIENETTKLMKDTYSDVMEHYKTALIALKEKQEREKKVEQLDGYSFEVGV